MLSINIDCLCNYIINDALNSKVEASEAIETGWFRRQSVESIEYQQPEEGKDWNTYFQYEAHKNLLKELPEDDDEK